MFNGIAATSLLLLAFTTVAETQTTPSPQSISFAEEFLLDAFDEILDTDGEDFHIFVDGEEHRHLKMGIYNYNDPEWWKEYKKHYGKHFKRCKFQENIAPVDGTSCQKMLVGDYTCMFEDQVCEDGSVQPAVKCDCLRKDMTWQCESYNACKSDVVTECPKEHPVTFNPPLACSGDMSCPIGIETCCGEDFAKYDCTCKDGLFDCDNVHACAGRVCPKKDQCPNQDTDIAPQGKCNIPPDVKCAYGEVCCCDNCMDETTCSCDEATGEWLCASIAIRCQSPCPPPIDGDKCSAEDEVVAVGEVECCGSKLPEWECTCSSGRYNCDLKNSPSNKCACAAPAPEETCPGEDTDTPPKFGEECSAFSQGTTCSYRETCCCNDCFDSTTCTCNNGSWECASKMFDCQDTCPPAITGTACKAEGEVVPVGPELECCGSNIPEFECTCTKGSYQCKQKHGPFDSCLCIPEAVCPGQDTDTPPKPGTQCVLPAGETCSYREACCCNDCMDTMSCSCEDGIWLCLQAAMACMATCPPPISGTDCKVDGETFNQGEKECCGSTLPVWEVKCSGGVYHTNLLNDPDWSCLCAQP